MFLEMAKDMPRGRQESLSRLLVPILVVAALLLALVAVRMVGDTRDAAGLEQQVEQQVESSGVLLLDDPQVPRDGERAVQLLVDGRPTEGVIRVDGDVATLLVRSPDGSLLPVAPAG